MTRTFLYIIILALLSFSVYFFIIKADDNNPYGNNEAGFNIKDTGSVGKIFIANNFKESVLVERTDSGWMVNKKYKAFNGMVNVVLSTLAKQNALYPVTKNAFDNVVKELSTDGMKVEIYDRKGVKMRVFYVGGASVNNTGTNMMMEGAKTPFVVQERGFVGVLTPRYRCELKSWRDRTVFDYAADNIKSIVVDYFDHPENSFSMTRNNGIVAVVPNAAARVNADSINMNRVNYYLTYFSKISCEGILNGAEDLDGSIVEKQKYVSIDIADNTGKTSHTDIYWMPINRRSKNQLNKNPGVPDEYDADRMYAVINGGVDTVLIQKANFYKIFRSGKEFFERELPVPKNAILPKIHKVPVNR